MFCLWWEYIPCFQNIVLFLWDKDRNRLLFDQIKRENTRFCLISVDNNKRY